MLSPSVPSSNVPSPFAPSQSDIDSASYPQTTMRVKKRNGGSEPVNVNKIVRAVNRCCAGLPDVDALRVAMKTISGLYDGASTRELDQLSIQTAAGLIVEEPQYAKLAARLLSGYIEKEVRGQEIHAFSQAVSQAHELGLVNERLVAFTSKNARKLNDSIAPERDREFEYFGLRTLYDRYLLKHPKTRLVIETPQQFFMRIACALSENVNDALELYRLFSSLEYLPSSPTLFNSGMKHEQLSSCFLLDSPDDHLEKIYKSYTDIALLVQVLRRHWARISPRALARVADREHERQVQRHRAVAEDARCLRVGGEPRRQAQGRLRGLPRDVARGHRVVPRATRQHGRRSQPHAQPEPGQLGQRSVHATRRSRRETSACSTRRPCRTCPICTARSSIVLTKKPSVKGSRPRPSRPATCTRA